MSLDLFQYLASETFGLWHIARNLSQQFEIEGVPEELLTPVQDIIHEADRLRRYLRHKSEFEAEIVDHLNDYPRCTDEWLRLMNQLYESTNALIHQFSITKNDYIESAIGTLEEYQKESFAASEFSKDIFINLMIDSIQRFWSNPIKGLEDQAKARLASLLRYITHLQETAQVEEADQLLERLVALDLNHAPLSLAYAQVLIRRGDQNAAREIINQVLEKNPKDELALELKTRLSGK